MRLPALPLAFLLLAGSLATSPALSPSWPQDASDLKADAKAVYGRLENGLRYVVLPNEEPPGRVSLRLYMDTGSLMEADDQQGMAHFLEHMAFNGTRNFPGGEMVEYFQRLGMAFGADTNAHTSFKETVYQLELPKVEEPLMKDGLKLFRDYLDGMLLRKDEIDKERGVILSEKLSRDSVDYRTMVASTKFAMPDSLISSRMPIGLEKTIKAMPRERFVDYYETYYTPERATVVVVGDLKDTKLPVQLIEQMFKDAKPRRGDSPDPNLGKITQGRGLIAMLHTEMEAPATSISIESPRPASQAPDTAARRREILVRDLGDLMVNQRFSKLAKAENAPILSGESYSYEFLKFAEVIGVMAQCKPEHWKDAVTLLETELRRALQYGFTDAEFEEACASILKSAKLRAEQASTRQSRALASQVVSQLAAEKVFTHPADDLPRVEAMLKNLTKEECLDSYRKSWETKDINIFVGGNLKLEGDAQATILKAYNDSAAKPVSAPEKEKVEPFAYTDFGPAGKVVKRTESDKVDGTMVVFDNNVKLNLKRTPFEKGAVRVLVSIGGGKLELPKTSPGLLAFAQSNFQAGGLEKHSVDDLRRIFASRAVGSDFAVGDDSFMLAGRTTPDDLDAQLQLLTAYIVAPGYRDEAERQFKRGLDSIYTSLEHTAEGVMTDKVSAFIHSEDPRFGFPDRPAVEKEDMAALKGWLSKPLKEGYVEVAVVGDIDVDKTIESVARTLGALPKRAATKPAFTEAREVAFPKAPAKAEFHFTTEIPKAVASIYWPTEDMRDIQRARRLILLGAILDDRLRVKVREELGETYSPACYHVASDTFTGYGYMTAMIELKPEHAASITELVKKIGDDLAHGPITEDEFERAKKPQITQLEQMRRDNRYWLQNVMRNCQERPERLDWAATIVQDFSAITREEVAALAKKYLTTDRAVTALVIPDEAKPSEAATK